MYWRKLILAIMVFEIYQFRTFLPTTTGNKADYEAQVVNATRNATTPKSCRISPVASLLIEKRQLFKLISTSTRFAVTVSESGINAHFSPKHHHGVM
jgi:hypothetical protein